MWPSEVEIPTLLLGNGVNCSAIFALHCFALQCLPNMMHGVGPLNFILSY